MNWQRDFGAWLAHDRRRPRGKYMYGPGGRHFNPAHNVVARPESGTGRDHTHTWTHGRWPVRAYDFRKSGHFVRTPDWVAVEIFLPTETPKFVISPFIRRALIRVLGRFKSASAQLNRSFDLFAGDTVADGFGHALLRPDVVQWLLNDPRTRRANMVFQTVVLGQGTDDVPFTQRHGVLVVEMPGRVADEGAMGFLAGLGADFLALLPGSLWQGQPPSGRAGR